MEVSLRPVDGPALAQVEAWLEEPHVRRYWGDPDDQRPLVRARPPGSGHAIIAADGRPVGYIRWTWCSRARLDAVGLTELPDGTIDVDIFLGEATGLDRGVGSRAVRLLVDQLYADPAIPLIGMITSVDNARAIRCYEKAGFARARPFEDPTFGACWLMVCRRG